MAVARSEEAVVAVALKAVRAVIPGATAVAADAARVTWASKAV